MLRRCGGQCQPAERMAIPPVELDHAIRRDAPGGQLLPHPQRDEEHRSAPCELADAGLVEMIVMVVRNDHCIDRIGQRGQRPGGRLEPRGGKRHGRGALRENRVDQHAVPVEFEEDRRMAEPGKADRLARLGPRRCIQRVFGQRFIGAAVAGRKQEIGEDRAEGIALARFGLRLSNRIAKPLRRAVELGRIAIAVHLGLRRSHREKRSDPPGRRA